MEEQRKPIAISVTGMANIYVLCDDGTVWVSISGAEWKLQGQPIPGTSAAKE